MEIDLIEQAFSICQLAEPAAVPGPFCFTAHTDAEYSLVCPTTSVPAHTIARDDGWRAFRLAGVLDFSLIGVLADISSLLAAEQISLFTVSTYNTDYIFTKEQHFPSALALLTAAGYTIAAEDAVHER